MTVVVLVLTAGCSTLVGVGDGPDEAVTPAPVPTAELAPARLPPGITAAGLENATALSTAHRQALSNRSYTMRERYVETLVRENVTSPTTALRRNETTFASDTRTYRHELEQVQTFSGDQVRTYRQVTYSDGEQWYERRGDGRAVTYTEGEGRFGRDKFAFEAAIYLNQYLTANQTWAVPAERDGTRLVRVVGIGGDPPWGATLSGNERYRVSILVDPEGVVHRLDVRYVTPTDEIRYSFWLEDVGATTVEPPAWLAEAQER